MTLAASTSAFLEQRGRAGLQLLGSLQAYAGSALLARARSDFEAHAPTSAPRAASWPPATPEGWRASLDDTRARAEKSLAYRYNRFFQRWVAEEQYRRGIPATERRRARLDVPLTPARHSARPSRLILDPSLRMPGWYAGVEWHLQLGGYDGYDLASPMFVAGIGRFIFSRGGYAAVPVGKDIRAHRAQVLQQLDNRSPRRLYDMGCGGSLMLTMARQQFPDAELVGGDLSAALLKSGLAMSEALGAGITFRQEDACAVAEADRSVDAVVSFAVFHEMPDEVARRALQEMFRILRPGGQMVISDPPPLRAVSPLDATVLDWETENRAEPYFTEAAIRDLPAMMRAAGFVEVSERSLDGELSYPWITLGKKPGQEKK